MKLDDKRRKPLNEIAPGDRVWVNRPTRIQPVARLTPAQIILDGYYNGGAASKYNRYERGSVRRGGNPSYYQIHGLTNRCQILAVATSAECKKWDAEQVVEDEAAAVKQREREAREAKKEELQSLFTGNANVSELYHPPGWQLSFWQISEDQIRQVAEFWNSIQPVVENKD
jgi:hypothetical protein